MLTRADYGSMMKLAATHDDRCLALFIGSLMLYRGRGLDEKIIMDQLQNMIDELDKAYASGCKE